MKTIHKMVLLLALLVTASNYAQSDAEDIYVRAAQNQSKKKEKMKTYVIEREIPNVGKLTQAELQGISQKSNMVITGMDNSIEWLHSYITDNKVYCIYKAESVEVIQKHAQEGGFPANSITKVSTSIDPSTANMNQ